MMKKYLLIFLGLMPFLVLADGVVVDKVYSPYVLPLEREIEWRFMSRKSDVTGNQLGQRLGFGHSITEYMTAEIYFIGEREADTHDFGLAATEFEMRWMLGDQGQYWADLGVLLEVEKEHNVDNWEVSTGILAEKEFGKTSLTVNLFVVYEWGQTLENEWETEARIKYRYRYHPAFQPAIEIYAGEDYFGAGPALQGIYRIDGQKQVKYQLGFITELSQSSGDHILRFSLEYEF